MKTINKIMLFAIALIAFSCEDILEDDISNDTIQIISPLNGAQIESNVVKFQWNSLKGADKYRVQVYGDNQIVVLDSLVENKTNLTYPLTEGDYQWRVRGENFAYQSTYSVQSAFSMIVSDDLTNQQVVLSAPDNDTYVNFTNVTLNWLTLVNATSYSVEVINVSNGQQVFLNPAITGTSVTMNNPNLTDGIYEWRVKAKNSANATETQQYASRRFSVDRVLPNQPGFVPTSTPADNGSPIAANTSITFTWVIPSDSGNVMSPITYVIQFSNDNFATQPFQSTDVTSTTFSQSFNTAGVYFWKVLAKDKAGNVSVPSVIRKFTLN